jgi:Zn ribbon nucleic-acid-binding protein
MNASLEITDDDERCPECYTASMIGVEIQGVYDGVLYWECLYCGHRWHRFPAGHYLHAKAEKYLSKPEPHSAHMPNAD